MFEPASISFPDEDDEVEDDNLKDVELDAVNDNDVIAILLAVQDDDE